MMRKHISTAVLTSVGLLALAIAARGLFAPAALGTSLGYTLNGIDGLNEVRAQYGGFFLGIGVACFLSLLGKLTRQTALIMVAVAFGGVLFGRVFSLALDGGFAGYGPIIRLLYIVDIIGLSAALIALRAERKIES